MHKQSCALFLSFFLLIQGIPFLVFAEERSLDPLRKEIQELKKTIRSLQETVQEQDRKIEALQQKGLEPPKEMRSVENKASLPQPSERPATTQKSLGFYKYNLGGTTGKLIPDISLIGIFSAAYFNRDPGESGHDPHRTGFNLQEIEVGFQSIIDPYVRADVFLSFHEEGVELEEGYITTLSLPKGLQIRAGKYFAPFGRQNQKHLETWHFANTNLVNKKIFGGEGFNELGMEVSYLFPTPFFLQLQTSFSQGDNEENFDGERKRDFAYTGRLSASADISDHWTALIGASSAFGFNKTEAGKLTSIVGGDFLLKWRPSAETGIDWQTEYIYRRKQTPERVESEGGFSSYLVGQWSKRWGAGFRLDYFGLPLESERSYRISPMLTYRPTEFFRLRAQYDYLKVRGEEGQHAAILQMIFNMGPHGAHQF